ncbi:hypothetical protein TNCV_3091451 [Trichonephila clavipes]|uniref:Uncharacterized protein n=1 Tax=Trichonephila clavipes TaxID=2585209 RepID=A0A8X6W8I6_TRICX|nr:hypothetical protein TNCV_3091451 [Trichonephila clavipes]
MVVHQSITINVIPIPAVEHHRFRTKRCLVDVNAKNRAVKPCAFFFLPYFVTKKCSGVRSGEHGDQLFGQQIQSYGQHDGVPTHKISPVKQYLDMEFINQITSLTSGGAVGGFIQKRIATFLYQDTTFMNIAEAAPSGRRSLVVKVTDSWPAYYDFESSTAEDPPCRGGMHVKSIESPNVLPLVWCGSQKKGCQLRCHSLHLTMVQNYEVRCQKLQMTRESPEELNKNYVTNLILGVYEKGIYNEG